MTLQPLGPPGPETLAHCSQVPGLYSCSHSVVPLLPKKPTGPAWVNSSSPQWKRDHSPSFVLFQRSTVWKSLGFDPSTKASIVQLAGSCVTWTVTETLHPPFPPGPERFAHCSQVPGLYSCSHSALPLW